MSKWSEIRKSINDRILAYFRIDSFTPDDADPVSGALYPPNTAIIYPAANLSMVPKASAVELTIDLLYEIQYWISESNRYNQLPLIDFESLLVSGGAHILTGVDGVLSITCQSEGVIVERGKNNKEWLCKLPLRLEVVCFIEEEPVPLLQPSSPTDSDLQIITIEDTLYVQ